MELKEAIIVWEPGYEESPKDRIKVGPFKNNHRWSSHLSYSDGACYGDVKKMAKSEAEKYAMAVAIQLIVMYELDPQVVHREMIKIDEYRESMRWRDKPEDE